MTAKNRILFSAFFCTLALYGTVAFAFDERAVVSVKEQSNEYYTAQGGRIGSLIVKPSIDIAYEYDDNIFREAENQKNDKKLIVQPDVTVETDWNMHQIRAGASAEFGRFKEFGSEDYDDHSYFVSGRLDMDYNTFATLDVRSQFRHEDRGSLDDVDGDAPIEFQVDSTSAGFTRALGVMKLYLNGIFRTYSYDDTSRAGLVVSNADRDREHRIYRGRIAYSLSDDYAVFIQAQHDTRNYDQSGTAFRDSDGQEYRGGVSVNISGKLQGDIYLGRLTQSYESDFDDISEVVYGGHLLWNLNGITSLRGMWENQVVETSLVGASGVLRTTARVELEHAFRDYFMFDGYTGFQDDQYEGNASSSASDNVTYTSGAGLDYKLSDKLGVRFDYDYLKRNFEEAGSGDYDNHKVRFSVKYDY